MTTDNWFDDLPTIGELPPQEAAAKLREVGEDELADALEAAQYKVTADSTTFGLAEDLLPWLPKPWLYPTHVIGYLTPAKSDITVLPIQNACKILPDSTLKNTPINITLEQACVAKYPGGGTHYILFDFEAKTQLLNRAETINFTVTHRIRESNQVVIINQPIFAPLHVSPEGVGFRGLTVNVKNQEDEAALSFLESFTFQSGIAAASLLQPAIAPLAEMAIGITKLIAKRSKNVTVQKIDLGLDFGNDSTRARLAEGYYLAIQIPESLQTSWDWNDWVYNPTNGQIVSQFDPTEVIPYNYLVFSVSRYQEK
ncbi:MAG: hypothetical protein RIM23_02370 [Coleofasciculus sp. G3-WIS-01]|uniref:hypothetical protein n=1 Tax=Coleofasciculus sp. G3-WIS-01 TaxID=3069528 RepID=UPI0032F46FAD